jgi:GNAT superfamily N-acetyltransferase
MNKTIIREGKPLDIPAVLGLVRELADFERALSEVTNTEAMMLRDGFGSQPLFGLIVAEIENELVGMAIHYVRYSTWKGPMLYLEDIYVKGHYRGKGIGSLLFEACIKHAIKHGYQGMFWQVLEWNTEAIDFYKKYHSTLDPEWINGKLNCDQMLSISNKLTEQ